MRLTRKSFVSAFSPRNTVSNQGLPSHHLVMSMGKMISPRFPTKSLIFIEPAQNSGSRPMPVGPADVPNHATRGVRGEEGVASVQRLSLRTHLPGGRPLIPCGVAALQQET